MSGSTTSILTFLDQISGEQPDSLLIKSRDLFLALRSLSNQALTFLSSLLSLAALRQVIGQPVRLTLLCSSACAIPEKYLSSLLCWWKSAHDSDKSDHCQIIAGWDGAGQCMSSHATPLSKQRTWEAILCSREDLNFAQAALSQIVC